MRPLLILLCAACGAKAAVPPTAVADLVLVNGDVLTMDPLRPRADGVAVVGDKIEAVGDAAEIKAWIGPHTRVVDLAGRAVSPGLVDGHCHLYELGRFLDQIDLRGAATPEEVAARVKAAAKGRGAGEWIRGRGWDQNLWPTKTFPTRALLDDIPQPVALERIDGHAYWMNGAALRAMKLGPTDPPFGKIVRDARGEPTGILVDLDPLVEKAAPVDPPDVRRRQILHAAEVALAAGITGIHEMGIDDVTIGVYRQLAAEGKLPLRVWALLRATELIDELPRRRAERDPTGTAFFVLGGVKLFADGALGSRGALLLEPYADDPGNRGLEVTSREALERGARNAKAGGWQLAVHAIGDRANRNVLDAFEAAGVGPNDRFRVEHAQILSLADIPRFAKLGVIASMQPTHATSDMPWAEARVGRARLAGAYAWRSLLDAKAVVVGGSDFPVEEVPIRNGIAAAVSRQDRTGKPEGGWLPEQRVTLDEALRMFTVAPAFASFQEARRGRIVPGFVADLTVFDRALFPDAAALYATEVDLTIVGGRVAYERSKK